MHIAFVPMINIAIKCINQFSFFFLLEVLSISAVELEKCPVHFVEMPLIDKQDSSSVDF